MTCVYAAIDGPKTGPGYLQGRRRKKRKTPNHPNVNVKMKHEERRSSSLFFDQAGFSPRRKRVISGHHHLNASRPVLRPPSAGIHCPSQTNRTRKLQNHGTFRYVHLAVDSMRRAYRSSRSQLLNISTQSARVGHRSQLFTPCRPSLFPSNAVRPSLTSLLAGVAPQRRVRRREQLDKVSSTCALCVELFDTHDITYEANLAQCPRSSLRVAFNKARLPPAHHPQPSCSDQNQRNVGSNRLVRFQTQAEAADAGRVPLITLSVAGQTFL
jgi:hypothetical protein